MKVISRREAQRRGIIRYYTGKPCRRGHVAERYASTGTCVACHGCRATVSPGGYRASVEFVFSEPVPEDYLPRLVEILRAWAPAALAAVAREKYVPDGRTENSC